MEETHKPTEQEILHEIMEIIESSIFYDEDRNGDLYTYYDSYKAAGNIIEFLKTNNLIFFEDV